MMKKYEADTTNPAKSNPFTLSFGNKPFEYVSRDREFRSLIERINSEPPLSHCFVITGVRGSGKTVALTTIKDHFEKENDWIVIELNPEDDMREGLAAKLYSEAHIKHIFLEKDFSFSFQGISFSIHGKNPVLNIDDLLDKMIKAIAKQGKRILVAVDEATNNQYMKRFALSFQILIRNNYPLFLLTTSLYENISSLENEKNMTFLIRAPKLFLTPLSLQAMTASYESTLNMTFAEALKCAKMTKGYAFAFQLLGYLLFEKSQKELNQRLMVTFDQYLEEYVYTKVWSTLTNVERNIVKSFNTNNSVSISTILERTGMKKEYFSRYRDRLIKKGILISLERGKLSFALPRFNEFIEIETAYLD